MNEESKNRKKLPIHEFPLSGDGPVHSVCVDGLVRTIRALTLADLRRLPQHEVVDNFTCLEGWTVPRVRWGGVLLKDALSLAEPLSEARYVQASARRFSLPLSLERVGQALLAIRLDENPIPREHGGPVRLIVSGGECFTSIKW